jgi:hypothetical protein
MAKIINIQDLAFPFPYSLGESPLEHSFIVIVLICFYKCLNSSIVLALLGFYRAYLVYLKYFIFPEKYSFYL